MFSRASLRVWPPSSTSPTWGRPRQTRERIRADRHYRGRSWRNFHFRRSGHYSRFSPGAGRHCRVAQWSAPGSFAGGTGRHLDWGRGFDHDELAATLQPRCRARSSCRRGSEFEKLASGRALCSHSVGSTDRGGQQLVPGSRPVAAIRRSGGPSTDHRDDAQKQKQRLLHRLPQGCGGGCPGAECRPDLGRANRSRSGQAERDHRYLDYPGVDVIAVAVENREGISSCSQARQRGIKVITWDADAETDARDFSSIRPPHRASATH